MNKDILFLFVSLNISDFQYLLICVVGALLSQFSMFMLLCACWFSPSVACVVKPHTVTLAFQVGELLEVQADLLPIQLPD